MKYQFFIFNLSNINKKISCSFMSGHNHPKLLGLLKGLCFFKGALRLSVS